VTCRRWILGRASAISSVASQTPRQPSRGRDTFGRFRAPLAAVTLLFGLLPRAVLRALWGCSDVLHGLVGVALRYCIAKVLAKRCGACVYIGPNVEVRTWAELSIGDNVSIHRGCYLDAGGGVEIGNDVSIAHHTSILSTNHTWGDPELPIRDNPVVSAPVVIENDVWVGCGCRILAGSRVRTRAVLAAGAVVTQDVPSGSLVGGVPARKLKDLVRTS
jgi:acetyltransferase-like isoleucine patch superfamily enzyme